MPAQHIPNWVFLLSDLHGNVIGELNNASNRQVVLPLNRNPTASLQIPIQHRYASYLADPTWDGLIKCYRDGVLRFIGPIVTAAESFDSTNGQTIAVNAAGPFWRLGYRYLGIGAGGWSQGDATAQFDNTYIAQQMLAYANFYGYVGIDPGISDSTELSSYGQVWFKLVSDAITELSTGINSFDWEVAPQEPHDSIYTGNPFPCIGLFNTRNLIGTTKPDTVFEYGTSKANVVSYGRQIDRTGLCNHAYILQPAATDHTGILESTDATSITARGVYQSLVDDGGVEWDVLRQQLADENVAIRKNPRQVVTFQPVQNASPTAFNDFIVGDQIRARIEVNAKTVLDAMMRVWGITFDIGPEGNEQLTLELIQP